MADVTVSAAGVAPTANVRQGSGTAGATITQGQPLYQDATVSNKLKPAVTTNAATANCVGIALNAASSGQPVTYAISGDVTFIGTTFVVGGTYDVSANAGGIAPVADTTAGLFVTTLGVATSATNLRVAINPSGVAHA